MQRKTKKGSLPANPFVVLAMKCALLLLAFLSPPVALAGGHYPLDTMSRLGLDAPVFLLPMNHFPVMFTVFVR